MEQVQGRHGWAARTTARGFTLLEVLVVLAIAGILMATAAPSLTSFMAGREVGNESASLAASLRLARSEALKRGTEVSICPSTDGKACQTNPDWKQGWIVFTDQNADGVLVASDGDLTVQSRQANFHGVAAVAGAPSVVTFFRNGIVRSGATSFEFQITSGSSSGAQKVCVNVQGRIAVKAGGAAC